MTAGRSGSDKDDPRGRASASGPPPPPNDSIVRSSGIIVPTTPPSRTLGRYELLVPIAEGGMASVWAARMKGQRGFQKIVAIKQMRPELSEDENFETMFLDEASLVSRLKHPNLAEIFDLGEDDGQLYQVMEYVDGEPLNRLIRARRGALPIPLAVYIAKEVCAGLHVAHELRDENGDLVGLVHRDISLQNILVSYDGVTKVIDFGVAKAVSNLQKTSVGQVKGKVPYMSPEQAVGDQVDRRTDIFALGIVLYQLVTGKHPFRGETELETMMHICDKKPVDPPSTLVPAIPPALDAVLLKALAKDKNARYSKMSEMLRELETALAPGTQASSEDLATFMKTLLGTRGDQRRLAIQEAGRLADAGPHSDKRAATIPPSTRMALSTSGAVVAPSSSPGAMPAVPSTIPPPSSTPSQRDTEVPPLSVRSAQRGWSKFLAGSGRTILIVAVMGTAGVGIGLGAVSVLLPNTSDVMATDSLILYPALGRARLIAQVASRVRFAPSPSPSTSAAAPGTGASANAGAPSASATSKAPKKKPAPSTRKPKLQPIL